MTDEGLNAGEAAVRRFYEAINAGDAVGADVLLDPGVRWHRPPDVPVTGTIEGAEAVGRMWAAFGRGVDALEISPSRFEFGAGLLLAPVTFRGSGRSGDFEFGGAQVFRVADGLIAEVWEFRSLPEARALLTR